MPSGLIALLDDVAAIAKIAAASVDDVAAIAKIAAASVDDIGAAVGKAGTKAAGVVIDDTAVTPRYVTGFTPDRELPIIAKIAWGSIKNKMLILLPAALLLTAFAPFLITPLLMLGGAYLAFEATEKIAEKLLHEHEHEEELVDAMADPADLEALQVKGAIRTDFILSAEIMVIALAELSMESLAMQSGALIAVAIGITIAVYGLVALIVKLDDIGLHMAERGSAAVRSVGSGLVHVVPYVLTGLSGLGTAAMLWVGGGIILHGMEELHFDAIPHAVYDGAHSVAVTLGVMIPLIEWLADAVAASIAGLIVGTVIVGAMHLRPKPQPTGEPAACPEEII